MSNDNIDYQKAFETLENIYPPAKGFTPIAPISSDTHKLLAAQNNIIIELLIRTNQKLDQLISTQVTNTKSTNLTEILDRVNTSISALTVDKGKRLVKSTDQKIVVWKDPTTSFPNKKDGAS